MSLKNRLDRIEQNRPKGEKYCTVYAHEFTPEARERIRKEHGGDVTVIVIEYVKDWRSND